MGRLQLESVLWAGVRGHHMENMGDSASEAWTLALVLWNEHPSCNVETAS